MFEVELRMLNDSRLPRTFEFYRFGLKIPPNNLKFFLFQLDTTDMFYMVTCGPFPTRVQMAKEKKKTF